ncbi:hypothetical protein EDD85DRAFT_956014 [Armillaria nabsnona]|nr:hypothetical protein EDD85DRAFT_956014 [Armillaria nabsnona]
MKQMTSDLTTEQTIAIGTAIVGVVLVFFTTALIFLTYGERIRQRLYQLGLLAPIVRIPDTDFRNAPFPYHYVLPYSQTGSGVDRTTQVLHPTATTTSRRTHRRATTTIRTTESSDEYVSAQETSEPIRPEQRNATPGPSNVPRTPSPELPTTQNIPGNLWVTNPNPDPWAELPRNYEVAAPDLEFPIIVDWGNFEHYPEQLEADPADDLVPHYFARGLLELPTQRPRRGIPCHIRLGAGHAISTILFPRTEPREFGHFPDENTDSDTDSDISDIIYRYGQRIPVNRRHRAAENPFNPAGPDYEWPALADIDQEISGPERSAAWELRRQDVETRGAHPDFPCSNMDFYLAIYRGDELRGGGMANQIAAQIHANRDRRLHRATSSAPWQTSSRNVSSETSQTIFDHFNQDDETFGGLDYDMPPYPQPLPYEPPVSQEKSLHPGFYSKFSGSRLMGGAGSNEGGWDGAGTGQYAPGPSQPTIDERMQQLYDQMAQLRHENERLSDQLEDWKAGKGKAPDRGRQ